MKPIHPHKPKMTYEARCKLYNQIGQIIWFTGISGSGKTTLATSLENKLIRCDKIVCLLDGDSLRAGLNSDLSFTQEDRVENIRRLAELAIYLANQAFVVIVSAISPHKAMRLYARNLAKDAQINFLEVYVKASIEVCQIRDPKGLYKKNQDGELSDFTGFESIYEEPDAPDIILDTERFDVDTCLQQLEKILSL